MCVFFFFFEQGSVASDFLEKKVLSILSLDSLVKSELHYYYENVCCNKLSTDLRPLSRTKKTKFFCIPTCKQNCSSRFPS